jgi:hypothetical protein
MYSTFDVERLFKIKKTRLFEWIDPKYNYVIPSQRASGKGSKALFSIDDLYRLYLFINLLRLGSSRLEASDYSKTIDFNYVGEGKNQFKFAYKIEEVVPKPFMGAGRWKPVPAHKLPAEKDDDELFFLRVNLVNIRRQVDILLAG